MKKDSKFKNNKSTVFELVLFIILAIFVVILIATLHNEKKTANNESVKATETVSPTGTVLPSEPTAENTEAPGETEIVTSQPTENVTMAPTQKPTSAPTSTQKPSQAPDVTSRPQSGHAKIVDPSSIDYSFLSGVPTGSFDGSADFDWYPGNFKYDEKTKTVVPGWGERGKNVLDWLDKYNGVYVQNSGSKVIYLTFDCGYENGVTEKILNVLKEKNAQGIFFVTGEYVVDTTHDTAKIMKRMIDEGHLIGSHTDNHKVMPKLSNEEFVKELNGVYTKIRKVLGDDFTFTYYRPPQGASNPRDMVLADYLGYKTTFWAFAYGDYDRYNQPDKAEALKKMKEGLRPGAVYLLHAISETNASVLGEFIDWVRDQGYEIRRIDK